MNQVSKERDLEMDGRLELAADEIKEALPKGTKWLLLVRDPNGELNYISNSSYAVMAKMADDFIGVHLNPEEIDKHNEEQDWVPPAPLTLVGKKDTDE
jgi:hypothetical protein